MTAEDWKDWKSPAISRDIAKLLRKSTYLIRQHEPFSSEKSEMHQIRDCCVEENQQAVLLGCPFNAMYSCLRKVIRGLPKRRPLLQSMPTFKIQSYNEGLVCWRDRHPNAFCRTHGGTSKRRVQEVVECIALPNRLLAYTTECPAC